MTERQAPYGGTAECLSCGISFVPRKFGHVFCGPVCPHRGERRLEDREPADPEQLARLFDEDRDPDALVGDGEWHPSPKSEFVELDAGDTVADRRCWYGNLLQEGLI